MFDCTAGQWGAAQVAGNAPDPAPRKCLLPLL